jgi:uncharacterized membrane protein YhaH (DUF805 family)
MRTVLIIYCVVFAIISMISYANFRPNEGTKILYAIVAHLLWPVTFLAFLVWALLTRRLHEVSDGEGTDTN